MAKGGRVEMQWDRGGDEEEEEDAVVKLSTTGTM